MSRSKIFRDININDRFAKNVLPSSFQIYFRDIKMSLIPVIDTCINIYQVGILVYHILF